MFVLPDLYVLYILEDFFRDLRNNPEKLNYILSGYSRFEKMIEKTGTNYINECVSFIYDNKIKFVPGYELNSESVPCISTLSYSGEDNQFIGDTGMQNMLYNDATKIIKPIIYHKFAILSSSETTLTVPQEYDLINKLWRNIFIVNGNFSSQVVGMRNAVTDGNKPVTLINLKDTIPSGLDKTLWTSQSGPQEYLASLSASQEHVTVLIKLITSGDYSVHRLLNTVLRYALKANRLNFDNSGLQNSTFTFQMPQPFNDQDKGFETTVIMNTLITDHWIEKLQKTIDPATGLYVDIIAEQDFRQDVLISHEDDEELVDV